MSLSAYLLAQNAASYGGARLSPRSGSDGLFGCAREIALRLLDLTSGNWIVVVRASRLIAHTGSDR